MKRTWTCVQTIHHSLSLFAFSPLKQHFGLNELNLNASDWPFLLCVHSLVGGWAGSVAMREHMYFLSLFLSVLPLDLSIFNTDLVLQSF